MLSSYSSIFSFAPPHAKSCVHRGGYVEFLQRSGTDLESNARVENDKARRGSVPTSTRMLTFTFLLHFGLPPTSPWVSHLIPRKRISSWSAPSPRGHSHSSRDFAIVKRLFQTVPRPAPVAKAGDSQGRLHALPAGKTGTTHGQSAHRQAHRAGVARARAR